MNYIPTFSETDQKTRALWKKSFTALLGLTALNCLIYFPHCVFPPEFQKVFLPSLFAAMIVVYSLQYYCIYKKHGTRWLTFLLVFSPISVAYSVFLGMFGPKNPLTDPPIAMQVISYIASLLFLIPCYQMRKVNRRIQLEKKEFLKNNAKE